MYILYILSMKINIFLLSTPFLKKCFIAISPIHYFKSCFRKKIFKSIFFIIIRSKKKNTDTIKLDIFANSKQNMHNNVRI